MYKTTDTIIVDAIGKDEDIERTIDAQVFNGYTVLAKKKDSLFIEDHCGSEEIKILKTQNNEKKYCYPN